MASGFDVGRSAERTRRAETWRPRLAMADYAQAIFALGMEVAKAPPPQPAEAPPRALDDRAWFAAGGSFSLGWGPPSRKERDEEA